MEHSGGRESPPEFLGEMGKLRVSADYNGWIISSEVPNAVELDRHVLFFV
jgi:hypothetical protein